MIPTRVLRMSNEVEKFTRLSNEWWNLDGPFKLLHRMNPFRVQYIAAMQSQLQSKSQQAAPSAGSPLAGKRILDVGCGGGILSLALASLGANVLGIDAGPENIQAASRHRDRLLASRQLPVSFRNVLLEELAEPPFDIVVCSEVVEHVELPAAFVAQCATRLKDGGLLVLTTINRTAASFILAKVAAEALGLVPRGSHEFAKFIKPSELSRMASAGGCSVVDVSGLHFNPLSGDWMFSTNTAINYFLAAVKKGQCE
jgi:ubiquinone biosynthesis O-methyltransferase